MKTIRLSIFALAAGFLLLSSCNKDNSKPDVIQYQQPFVADNYTTIDTPAGLTALSQNGDVNASSAIAYIMIFNTYSAFSTYFALPQDGQKQSGDKNSVIYTWSYGGFSTWMTYRKESDKYVWTWDWQAPSTTRFTYMTAEQDLDGKSGTWSIYNADSPDQVDWTKSWSTDANGNYSSTIQTFQNSGPTGTFEVTRNADGSGNLIYNSDSEKQAEINWNADGSGDYWILNSDGPASNSWPAGK
ncbi:MAG TPA: hypothetical protein VE870_10600 [Bacteroidales bacterium]|nr:hypothetical protein [Bacteroidales bacterium]